MKRAAILAALATLLLATTSYAPCFYPHSAHQDYFQRHISCGHEPPCGLWEPVIDYWSLDGTCDKDCEGNWTCEGDTEVRSSTYVDTTLGPCDPICE